MYNNIDKCKYVIKKFIVKFGIKFINKLIVHTYIV